MSCSGRTGNKAELSTAPLLDPNVANWEIVNMSTPGFELGNLDISHLASSEFEEVVCNDLASLNDVELLLNWRPSVEQKLPEKGKPTIWTIEFPFDTNTHSAGAKLEFSGFITAWSIPTIANNELIQTPVTIKPDGDPLGDPDAQPDPIPPGARAFTWTPAQPV